MNWLIKKRKSEEIRWTRSNTNTWKEIMNIKMNNEFKYNHWYSKRDIKYVQFSASEYAWVAKKDMQIIMMSVKDLLLSQKKYNDDGVISYGVVSYDYNLPKWEDIVSFYCIGQPEPPEDVEFTITRNHHVKYCSVCGCTYEVNENHSCKRSEV